MNVFDIVKFMKPNTQINIVCMEASDENGHSLYSGNKEDMLMWHLELEISDCCWCEVKDDVLTIPAIRGYRR